ncbi:MAG: ATPase, T2SS/T4P/T4SS family [Eubacteriales bacterium]|nr:ATPase, T2SS/T4P/T4SS family [Eubacteriales bacterium]
MNWYETIAFFTHCLPKAVARPLNALPDGSLREIRVRAGQSIRLSTRQGETICPCEPTPQQVAQMAEALCEHALYARAEEQRSGFVTLRGGHRMGLCGRVICQGQSIRALRDISSFCIRIAGQWRGAADGLIGQLTDENGFCRSTLIVGLPGMGKTTLLRDSLRRLSEAGRRVCVVDERSEIAAMCDGLPQLEVGPCTDVLDGCGKEAGLRWLLRSLSPEVLVTDELSDTLDAQAALEAIRSGVSMLATVHGRDLDSVCGRNTLYPLIRDRAFERYAVLDVHEVGKLAGIYDRDFQPVVSEEDA